MEPTTKEESAQLLATDNQLPRKTVPVDLGMAPSTTHHTTKKPKKKVFTGESDFYELVVGDFIVVDKTLLIRDFLNSGHKVSLVTRPRRFGKTLNLSMMEYFFQIPMDENPTKIDIFKDLNISDYSEICKKFKQKYAVINVDLKSVTGRDALHVEGFIQMAIERALTPHLTYLKKVTKGDIYTSVIKLETKCENAMGSSIPFILALESLMDLYKSLHIRVIALIDEYDVPFRVAYDNGHFDDTSKNFMKPFLLSVLKHKNLFKAMITGISPIAQQSIWSEVSNVEVGTVLHDMFFTSYFGFTQKDVEYAIDESGVEVEVSDLKKWYEGYLFGDIIIYSPWSCLMCIRRNGSLESYWPKTGSIEIIKPLARAAGIYVKSHFDELLTRNGTIKKQLYDDLKFDTLKTKEESFWTLLVQAGYLNAVLVQSNKTGDGKVYVLKIPNLEIKDEFKTLRDEVYSSEEANDLRAFQESIIKGDKIQIKQLAESFLNGPHCFFQFDTNSVEPFQKFMAGLILRLNQDYKVTLKIIGELAFIKLDPYDESKQNLVIALRNEYKTGSSNTKNITEEKKSELEEFLSDTINEQTVGTFILISGINKLISVTIDVTLSQAHHIPTFVHWVGSASGLW